MVAVLAPWWARYSTDLPSLALLSDEGLNDFDDRVLLSAGDRQESRVIAIAIPNVITLQARSTTMTRMEARDLAKRIQVLPDAEQVKILSRVMQAEGRKVPWSDVEAIRRRMGKLDVDDEKFTREIVEAVREVRRERRRKSRS
jgi:hypothetical protein